MSPPFTSGMRGGVACRGTLELSIVVPAFNEEQRLPKTLQSIRAYLETRSLRAEVLVVDDGSTDATAKVVELSQKCFPELQLISNGCNRGKGFSVRQGMLAARGEIALFTDADLSAPIEEADKLLAAVREGAYDGAIGSRAVDRRLIEVHQSAFRERAGILFNRMVRWLTGLPFEDTQCGFKAFHRERARTIFERQRTEGFGFDPEILFLAQLEGLRVAEVPVRWAHNPATKVNLMRDSVRMLVDLLAVRWNAWMGRYSTEGRQ
jgi:glycosyltransferase involved in cell wall biosynthesis